QTSLDFLQMSHESNIYDYIATNLHKHCGDAVVVATSFDDGDDSLNVETVCGLEKRQIKLFGKLSHLKLSALKLKLPSNVKSTLKSGRLNVVKGGLYTLLLKRVPQKICDKIAKCIGLSKIYSIGLIRENKILGSVVLLVRKDILDESLVTAFVHQASIALQARQSTGQLMLSEERYHTTIDSLKDGLHLVDKNLKIILFNNHLLKWCRKLGLQDSVAELRLELASPLMGADSLKDYNHVFKTGQNLFTEESRIVNGERIVTETRKIPILINGNVERVMTIIRDITKRKIAEEEVKSIKNHLEAVLDGISESIVVLDRKYNIVSYNRAFQKWVGRPLAFLGGRKCFDVIHGFDKSCRQCVIRDVFRTGVPAESIHSHNLPHGKLFHETRAYPIFKDGIVDQAVYIFRDVTDREKMKEQLKQNYEQIKSANEELKKLDRMKNEFLAISSHELKTPISIINGYADIIHSEVLGSLTQEQKKRVKRIKENSEHLNTLVTNILDLTRMESGDLKLHKKSISISSLIRKTVDDMSHMAAKKNVKIIAKIIVDTRIFADQLRVKQILVNLIENAIKFTPPTKKIYIETSHDRKDIIISVMDEGVGIPKVELRNIFNKFYQIDSSTKRAHGGSGLGLAICKHLVELHGGTIAAESKLGKGSKFTVKIPLNNNSKTQSS
ncbi:MAG: PAS domain-containing sensor histidine kinase, partial [Candidatus Altiarchaeota archaeon]|nr:PAS domain-containing sensor histidine kinase [Candidatus Altiarchaeota archaeon]